jgi:hypothetical protein
MKSVKSLRATAIGLLLLLAPGASARAAEVAMNAGQALWERQSVRLVAQDQPARPSDHPAQPSPEELATLLAALSVSGEPAFLGQGGSSSSVFTEAEAGVLAKDLAARFAEARPDQDIAFTVDGQRDAFFFLKEPIAIGGRAFLEGQRLNIIFGDLLQPSGRPFEAGNAKAEPRLYPIRIGTRAGEIAHRWRILPMEGQSFHEGPDGTRRDWIVIDLAVALAAQGERQGGQAAPPAVEETRSEARRFARETRWARAEIARMQQLLPRIRGGTEGPGTLSRRIATLEELKAKGFITPEQLERERSAMQRDR